MIRAKMKGLKIKNWKMKDLKMQGWKMKDRTRRRWVLLAIIITGLLIFRWGVFSDAQGETTNAAMQAVLGQYESDTGAMNAVTAVYLNYRLFDTLFEALLLMVAVTGIVWFLEEKAHDEEKA